MGWKRLQKKSTKQRVQNEWSDKQNGALQQQSSYTFTHSHTTKINEVTILRQFNFITKQYVLLPLLITNTWYDDILEYGTMVLVFNVILLAQVEKIRDLAIHVKVECIVGWLILIPPLIFHRCNSYSTGKMPSFKKNHLVLVIFTYLVFLDCSRRNGLRVLVCSHKCKSCDTSRAMKNF